MIKTSSSSVKRDQNTIKINLEFDLDTFNQLVLASIDKLKNIIKENNYTDKMTFLLDISIHIEIIEHFISLESENIDLKINSETKKTIKVILLEINNIIEEIENSDYILQSVAEKVKANPKVMEML